MKHGNFVVAIIDSDGEIIRGLLAAARTSVGSSVSGFDPRTTEFASCGHVELSCGWWVGAIG